MRDYPFAIESLGPVTGARIGGLDLARPLGKDMMKAVNRAFLEFKVLVFKDQDLTPAEQLAFSQQFGPLEIHVLSQFNHPDYPEIFRLTNRKDEKGNPIGAADGGSYWHSDMSYKEEPAKATILHAKEIPDVRADTEFVDMEAACAALPVVLRHELDGKTAIHAYRSNRQKEKGTSFTLSKEQLEETPPVRHPILRTHPETGKKSIFAFPGIVQEITDMNKGEADRLLKQVFAHCQQPEFQFSLQWEVGDLAMWDNRCLMHRATTRDLPADAYRMINRTTVSGDRPF